MFLVLLHYILFKYVLHSKMQFSLYNLNFK